MINEIEFDLLGPLRIKVNGTSHVPRGPKMNKILALLLVHHSQLVPVEVFIDELWGEDPPRQPIGVLRTHVYHLRQLIGRYADVPGEHVVLTRPPGYQLAVGRNRIDASRFAVMADEGRRALSDGRAADALAAAEAGLRLWRGAPLANVAAGPVLAGHVRRIEELRIQTLSVRTDARLHLGQCRELVPELRELVSRYPLDEWFHARLIEALYRIGRRADALRAFQELRSTLDRELGVEPASGLRDLQRRILLGEDLSSGGSYAA